MNMKKKEAIMKLYKKKHTRWEIADILGTHPQYVYNVLKNNGVELFDKKTKKRIRQDKNWNWEEWKGHYFFSYNK